MKKDKIVAIIQARVSSTRLPRKVLLPLPNGQTVLENVWQRVKKSQLIDRVVIATTNQKADDELVDLCHQKGIVVFRGSEEDVLDRYFQAAKAYRADQIVRVTADCPLIDWRVLDQLIEKHLSEGNDFTANAYVATYPDGLDAEIFSFAILKAAWENAVMASQREHPTQYITRHPDQFKIGNLAYREDLSNKRWTLDEKEDYEFVKAIYQGLKDKGRFFTMEEVLDFLEKNPHLEKINHRISRNEGLAKSLKNDRIVKEEV